MPPVGLREQLLTRLIARGEAKKCIELLMLIL